jgi:hypothetical protein
MSNFQNPKVPPTGGRICRTHLAFHKGGLRAASRAALRATSGGGLYRLPFT